MEIVKAGFQLLNCTPDLEKTIELAGRVCYKSEDRITEESATAFIGRLMDSKHESVLEHGAITVRIVCDRGVSHELVRHRLASYSQESTRYCNYSQGKFGGEITVIDPRPAFPEMSEAAYSTWKLACSMAEWFYLRALEEGDPPQLTRSVLPNSLKTEVVITANPREWMHIFRMRTHKTAHPQMREVMIPLQAEFAKRWPALFGTGGD